MNFKQLEYFAAVAEARSISGASRELHVAQPPISRQLALLESLRAAGMMNEEEYWEKRRKILEEP